MVIAGCSVTLIYQNTIETVDPSYRADIESVSITLVTASGNELPILGKKKLTFKIGNNVYTHDILIVEIEGMSGIVSLDFLMKYDGKMHFKDNCLQLRNEMVHLIPESKAFFWCQN